MFVLVCIGWGLASDAVHEMCCENVNNNGASKYMNNVLTILGVYCWLVGRSQ